jgi:hypothetical protein
MLRGVKEQRTKESVALWANKRTKEQKNKRTNGEPGATPRGKRTKLENNKLMREQKDKRTKSAS